MDLNVKRGLNPINILACIWLIPLLPEGGYTDYWFTRTLSHMSRVLCYYWLS